MRLSAEYNPNSSLYRVKSVEGSTEYPPGRTLIKSQVDELIRRGWRVVVSVRKPPKPSKADPWAGLLARAKKR